MCVAAITTSAKALIPHETESLRYAFFRSIDAAGKDWDAATSPSDLFLQRPYLRVLENNPPEGMRFGYLVFYKAGEPIGVALCQIKYFKADNNINEADLIKQTKEPCFFDSLAQWFKRRVAGWAAADILICGNMLLTGDHAWHFDSKKISPKEAAPFLEKALNEVAERFERDGIKIPVILIKDVEPDQSACCSFFVEKSYTEFQIQPNMTLDLPYENFDAYLEAMSTKYRTRARRAFKKLAGVEKRELSLSEIQRDLPEMYRLYREVATNAGFNMVDLNKQYLPALKRDLSTHFRLFAYYMEGRLIAFFTTIQNGSEMEAHFLGYDKNKNHDYQIYLNILYDIVRIAFESACTKVVFARTALEIKSSVGAVPCDLNCYLRHQNNFVNHFTGALLDYLKPVEEWRQRHPFKREADLFEIS